MRVFFALKLPSAARNSLEELARSVERSRAKLVPPENYHVTLAFVGVVDRNRVDQLRLVAKQRSPVQGEIFIDRIQVWGHPPTLVATSVQVSSQLSQLAGDLQSATGCLEGMSMEQRVWRPHVTLARNVSQAPVLQAMSPICWMPTEFVLMESVLAPSGAVYTVVDTWPLLDKNDARAKSR